MSKKKSKAKQREINAHKKAWKKRTRQVKKKVLNGIILGKDQEEAEVAQFKHNYIPKVAMMRKAI